MYIPRQFQVSDTEQMIRLIEEYSFGTLFSQKDGLPFASHLPFLIERNESDGAYYVCGHMARSNPHWQQIDGQVLVVFQGPHAYISPTWYRENGTVPTWNYAAVHIYGEFTPMEDKKQVVDLIRRTVDHYESSMEVPWQTDLADEYNDKLLDMIVGFRIKVAKFEGKWKLSQNHSEDRRIRVIRALRETNKENENKMAELMELALPAKRSASEEKG